MRITLEDIFNIPSSVIYNPERYNSVSSVSIDTRTIKRNSIFVAIKGKNFDGHNYINEAISKGAAAVIINNKKINELDKIEVPIVAVKNTLHAYAELGKIWRNKLSAKVISITGSNGKTTTKEIIAHLLSSKYKVHKTLANNNNQIGVPLTILAAPANTDFIVLEHGTNHFGEIEFTAKIAQPDYAIITNIGNSHTQYLESTEKIFNEKSELFKYLKEDGIAFINNDDPFLKTLKKRNTNFVSYGFKGKCDVKGKRTGTSIDSKDLLSIEGFGKKLNVALPLIGESNSKNYLGAVSIALKIGITKKDILNKTSSLATVKGRLQTKDFERFTVIDDTYNANPESVKSALKVLKGYKRRAKHILVLGDMFELGESAEQLHKEIAEDINKMKFDAVYTIGKVSKAINDKLNSVKEKFHFKKRSSLVKHLNEIELSDSVILVKGSRGMKMEDFVNVLEKRAI